MKHSSIGLGAAVRYYRSMRGWSQEILSAKADLNRSYLGEVERGHASPSLVTVRKLAHALDISLSQLVSHLDDETEGLSKLAGSERELGHDLNLPSTQRRIAE